MFLTFIFRLIAGAAFAALSVVVVFPETARPGSLRWLSPWNARFDYVVVGGGTAGITVGARLAQNGFKVAIVEAGGYYENTHPISKVPGSAVLGVGADVKTASAIDWRFVADKVPGAAYRDIHYPRGNAWADLNFMIYQRPSKGAMERWADLLQDSSYSWASTLPFFKKTTTFTSPRSHLHANRGAFNNSAFDIVGEPLQVSYPRYAMPFSSTAGNGFTAIGISETEDFNSGFLMGHQYCSMTIRPWDQSRSSSESAFLRPAHALANLTIYDRSLVKKILFNEHKRATGIRVKQRWGFWNYDITIRAMREVIVSAGAIQSPQLLMVSGLGPAETLRDHSIRPIVNLPGVGQNMWDHVFFGPSYQVNVDTFTELTQNPLYVAKQIANYLVFRNGLFTNPSTDYIAFENLPAVSRTEFSPDNEKDLSWFPDDWPEYLVASAYVGNFSDPFRQQPSQGQYGSIVASLVASTSRGNITISSSNTEDPPIINPNWLATETDQKVAVAAYKRIRAAFYSDAMKSILVGPEFFPGLKYHTDADILNVIRNTVMTIYHAACTCKMGPRNDMMAVVDHKARVYGVHGLRVVDASAFPILPPGHPQSTVYMLAEKIAADVIHEAEGSPQ
ncbi:Dehydrogenase patE [Penicillium maclennaniae]|uniref:Dehydrogenase patE n=1 Tax=Penicillium maclennaniae TaxID=1343394 RepID=UPI002541712E|nr:Dehydrogenase patE [Penicillium maclennaniae]KAJ5675255.1 Dehydrogenase patE [Penicillium maclennaniae]